MIHSSLLPPQPGLWRARVARLSGLAAIGLVTLVVSAGLASSAQAAPHAAGRKPLAVTPVVPKPEAFTPVVPRVQAPKPAGLHPQTGFYGAVSLSASQTTLPGGFTTLTATTTADVGPTPYYIEIFDTKHRSLVAICGSGTSCSTRMTSIFTMTISYVAYVAAYPPYTSFFPPPAIQATSAASYVTYGTAWQLSLSANPTVTDGGTMLTATANVDVGLTPYWIEIFNEDNGTLIHECAYGSTCSVRYSPPTGPWTAHLIAFVANHSYSLPPANIQASSNEQDVTVQIIK